MSLDYLQIPACKLPVPKNVSPLLAQYIQRTSVPQEQVLAMQPAGSDDEGWYSFFNNTPMADPNTVTHLAARYGVDVEEAELSGVRVFLVTPSVVSERNRHRRIICLHGGAFVLGAGLSGVGEAIFMAHYSGIQVVSVDYRMPPKAAYPAALDDCFAVWTAIANQHDTRKVGLIGSSAGGNLVLALVQHAIAQGSTLPAAVVAGTPWADLAGTGDSYVLNEACDIMSSVGLDWAARQYAGGIDLTDPRLSPIYGTFSGFPPTMIAVGTRDMFLSDVARTSQKLREANVETDVLLFEAQRHGDYATSAFNVEEEPPEVAFAWQAKARFFDRQLQA